MFFFMCKLMFYHFPYFHQFLSFEHNLKHFQPYQIAFVISVFARQWCSCFNNSRHPDMCSRQVLFTFYFLVREISADSALKIFADSALKSYLFSPLLYLVLSVWTVCFHNLFAANVLFLLSRFLEPYQRRQH